MSLFDKTTGALDTALNMRLLKQDVISANIANAETPNYKAQRVDFEDQLARALDIDGMRHMETSSPEHYPQAAGGVENIKPEVYDDPDIAVNNDGNTVDMEKEMARLNENTIIYNAAVELINKKLGAMKYAAMDGGR